MKTIKINNSRGKVIAFNKWIATYGTLNKIDVEKIFVITNPLTWLYFLLLLFWELVKYMGEKTGVIDWYFVLFKMDKKKVKSKSTIIEFHEKRAKKLFWVKQKAWDYAVAKVKKELDS